MNQLQKQLEKELCEAREDLAKLKVQEGIFRYAFWIDLITLCLGVGSLFLVVADIYYIPGDIFVSLANRLVPFQSPWVRLVIPALFILLGGIGPGLWQEAVEAQKQVAALEQSIADKESRLDAEKARLAQERAEEEKQALAKKVRSVFSFRGSTLSNGDAVIGLGLSQTEC